MKPMYKKEKKEKQEIIFKKSYAQNMRYPY